MSVEGHSGFRNDPATVTDAQLERWLPDGLRDDDRYVEGMRKYLANTGYGRDATDQRRGVFVRAPSCSGRPPSTALRARGGFLRSVRAVVAAPRAHPPVRGPVLRGPNPGTARYTRAETYLEPGELRQMNAVYGASLTNADRWLGEFMARFRDLGLHENTAVVFLSDHGILLGERGWTGKIAQELHPELIQVPCVMVDPAGRGAGTTSSYFASTHDVAPTLMSMAGVQPPAYMEGEDLSPLFDGGSRRSAPTPTAATSTTCTSATAAGPTWPTTAAATGSCST